MYKWAQDLFPVCRSLTGTGNLHTLEYLKKILPDLQINSVPSGYKAFDWTVPDEWSVETAYIANLAGTKIVDFEKNNLHLLGYSEPFEGYVSLEQLKDHIYTLPDQPDAIPYVTSYYKRRWGFCVDYNTLKSMNDDLYYVKISASHFRGHLTYGELYVKATNSCDDEVLLSTYICHPSMANNELSGPVVATALAKWISKLESRKYNYRILFVPETLGSIVYLSLHLNSLKSNVKAGFNLSCLGDERCYSYLPTRSGNTISDRVACHVLSHIDPYFKQYSWLDRGSDERQYCAPGIDLPIASLMRSKYGEYPEYHTSLDDLYNVVTSRGLTQSLDMYKYAILSIEYNCFPKALFLCEPHLGPRGLYPNLSTRDTKNIVQNMMNLLTYADGEHDLLSIAELINVPIWILYEQLNILIENNIITISD